MRTAGGGTYSFVSAIDLCWDRPQSMRLTELEQALGPYRISRVKQIAGPSQYVFHIRRQPLVGFVSFTSHEPATSVEFEHESGQVTGIGDYPKRKGLLLRQTRKVGNPLKNDPTNPIPARRDGASNGQTELTRRFFYEPIFNQVCAVIEERGNPIDDVGIYFTPQNGGTAPTDADRSRYATILFRDYQKDTGATVTGDADLQALLGLNAADIEALIDHVDGQMTDTGGSGGLPAGFEMDLGDINGDGTGDGAASGLPAASHLGSTVKVKHPDVRSIGSASITTQTREELFTRNDRGQETTYTDPEGNVTAYVRYPASDPEGDGRLVASALSNKQYGRMKEVHVDVDPLDVMSLIGGDGDLADFTGGIITRTNTPGEYQDLVTRYEGNTVDAGGCSCCAYDPLGNPLAETDHRGFTALFDRNELGEVFRTTSPDPYRYHVETHFDANRNAVRVDTEDKYVRFDGDDPTSAGYGHFTPTGSGSTAHVPMKAGAGGAIRPGWFTDQFMFDLLDDLVVEDRDATGSTPDRLVTRHEHDASQNRVKTTRPEGNIVEYDHDERNLQIAVRVGRDESAGEAGSLTVTAWGGNGKAIQTIGPARRGAAGNEQSVVIEDAFRSAEILFHTGDFAAENTLDGFDRVIKTIDAAGNTQEMKHDPGGRVVEELRRGPIGGLTPTDRTGSSNVDLSKQIMRFDEAGRGYETQDEVFAPAGLAISSGRSVTHTGGGLATNSTGNGHTALVIIVSAGSATGNSSYVLTRNVHDRAGRAVETIDDNAAVGSYAFDGANRRIQETDAAGNVTDTEHDPAGNPIAVTRTEACTITEPAVPGEAFTSRMRYDCLNRLVVTAEPAADGSLSSDLTDTATRFTLMGYDSRGNATVSIDPKRNSTVTVYDGASRATQTQQHLRETGLGENPPPQGATLLAFGGAGVTTTSVLDGNSRLRRLIDDRGGVTAFEFDTLDRETVMRFHDGSTRTRVYNAAGNVVQLTDENGSVFDNTFDVLGRKVQCDITKASGVVGTDQQTFEYDGLSREVQSVDSVGTTSAIVDTFFDSLSRVLEDSQTFQGNTRDSTNSAFESYPAVEFTFPGGRQIANTFDALYRRTDVSESGGGSIAAWEFFGSHRVAEVALGNGLICAHMNDARTRSAEQEGQASPAWGGVATDRLGYDGGGRAITKRYLAGGINGTTHAYDDPTSVVGFTTSFDRSSNKFYERHLHAESRSHLYQPVANGVPDAGYDSIDRLRQYQRGTLASGGGSVSSAISLPNTDESRTYDLDGLGNWRRTTFDPVGGSETTEVRQHNYLNQITKRDATTFSHDLNGNLLDDGTRLYIWDAFNRLKVVKRKSGDVTIGEYDYDAGWRRIRKVVSNGGLSGTIPNGTTDFLYLAQQCVEERDGAGAGTKQYVWGIYIDELLQQKHLVTINGHAAGDYYPLSDLLYRTTALTDSTGAIIEAYDTDAYGNTLIFNAAGTGGNWWADDATQTLVATCDFIFTGRRHDAESALYFYRFRIYSPSIGRFVTRDPLIYKGDIFALTHFGGPTIQILRSHQVQPRTSPQGHVLFPRNGTPSGLMPDLYTYAESNATIYTDPFGEYICAPCDCVPPPPPAALCTKKIIGLIYSTFCIGLCHVPRVRSGRYR